DVSAFRSGLSRGGFGTVLSVTGLVGPTRRAVLTTSGATTTAPTATRTTAIRSLRLLGCKPPAGQLGLVATHPDAEAADAGVGFVDTDIDVRAQRVQRHTTFAVELGTAHLSTAEAARALHADALGTCALRALDRLAHRTAEGHAAGELFGNALGDE